MATDEAITSPQPQDTPRRAERRGLVRRVGSSCAAVPRIERRDCRDSAHYLFPEHRACISVGWQRG